MFWRINSNRINILISFNRIFNLVAEINSGTIFSLLPPNVLTLAFTMYNIEYVGSVFLFSYNFFNYFDSIYLKGSFEMVPFMFLLVCIISFLIWPFLFCYFASMTTEHVANIGETVYNSNWFEYPIEFQKYVILIMARSQNPLYFNGLNLFGCTLHVFGRVGYH